MYYNFSDGKYWTSNGLSVNVCFPTAMFTVPLNIYKQTQLYEYSDYDKHVKH